MKLSKADTKNSYKIIKITEDNDIRVKLFSLGVMEGDTITITHRAPLGSPIALRHDRGNFFALRKEQAELIEVIEVINNKTDGNNNE